METNKSQGISREVGNVKQKGKHLLFSQPALLPGRWLAHSRKPGCRWLRWPMCWGSLLQNEAGGERGRLQRTRGIPESAPCAWCMVRDPPASLHQLWSLSNQKLHLAHPTNVFSSCAAFQSPKPLKIQNLSLINVRSKVTAECEDSLWEPFAPAKRA